MISTRKRNMQKSKVLPPAPVPPEPGSDRLPCVAGWGNASGAALAIRWMAGVAEVPFTAAPRAAAAASG